MRPAEFSQENIIAAGRDLQASGRNITGFALRQRVGGGDARRLKQVWDEYLASQSEQRVEPVAELPVEVAEEVAGVTQALTERITALAVELNNRAVKAAERRVAEVVRTAGEQREQAERELADASDTVQDLEAQLDAKIVEHQATQERLAEVMVKSQGQEVELAQMRERCAALEKSARLAAEQHAAEAAKLAGSLEAAQAEVLRLQEAHQEQAVALAQVRERLTVVEQAAAATREQYTGEIERMNAAGEAERRHYQQEVEQVRSELSEQREASKALGVERDVARAEVAQLRTDLAGLTAKAEAAEQTHQDQRRRAAEETHRCAERIMRLESERDEARSEAATLRGQLEAKAERAKSGGKQ